MKVWLIGMVLSWSVTNCFAAGLNREVSRTPPEVYAAKLAPLLTKWEEVVEGRFAFKDDQMGGIVLLDENLYYRHTDGLLYHVEHRAYHAVAQSAVKSVASDTFTFDHERESIFLIDAATVLPDGTRQPVEANGTFIQTPQRAASDSLYTSSAELNVIFPSVSPGTSVEVVVLIRENTPVVAGEFATRHTFGSAWPSYRHRLVVDLPVAEWGNMGKHSGVSGVPEPVSETYADTRERRTWSKDMIAHLPWEERAPDYAFCAPTLWLTTLSDWNAIAAWFDGLVADRSELGKELDDALTQWTKGVKEREKIIEILEEKVADDIRYTGLEFGLAGYQPNPCREIWGRRYGDCKDKANLLRALLARKGIHSYVALLNAESGGLVEKASPSWGQFDHAILAVEKEGGGYLFCDPTAKYLPPGVLPVSDLDRDILVIRGKTAEWVRTPDLLSASTAIRADLSLSPDGELSGWFQVNAEGADAALYAAFYADYDRDSLVRHLQRLVEEFFPGAEVMDTDFKAPGGLVSSFQLRAYFIRPSRAATGNTVKFPFPADWLPDLDTAGQRHYPYYAKRRKTVLTATIELPTGWTASGLPLAFSAPSDTAQITAQWSLHERSLKAELSWWPEHAVLSAKEYSVMQTSIRALKAWFDQPAQVSGNESAAAPVESAVPTLTGFPILPTGEGQLKLLGEKFPEDGKGEERRAALQKILQWFPQDAETVFTAKVLLVQLDEQKLGDKVFAEKINGLLRTAGTHASAAARAWAQYLEASARWNATKDPGALARLKSIAEDKTLPSFRRGWAAYQAGVFTAEKDPRAALKFLKAYDRLEGDAQPAIIGLTAKLYARLGDADGLRVWAEKLTVDLGEEADRLIKPMVEKLNANWATVPRERQADVIDALRKVVTNSERFPTAWPALETLRGSATQGELRETFIRAVRDHLGKNPPKWWTREKLTRFATDEALIQHIKERNEASDAPGTVDGVLQLLLHHSPDFPTFAFYTRWAMWWLSNRNLDEDLLQLLAAQMRKFPAGSDDEVVQCWNVYSKHLASQRKFAEARELLESISAAPEVQDYQKVEAAGELGKLELAAGRVDEALAAFDRVEPIHTSHRRGIDYLYVAMLVRLEKGDFDRALALLQSIKKQDTKWIQKATHAIPIGHLLKELDHPEKLKRYWEHAATWRPLWTRILTDNGVTVSGPAQPPAEEDFAALAERLNQALVARNEHDFLAALDTYVHLAQWIPIFVNDLGTALNKSVALSKPLWGSLAKCMIAIVHDAPSVNPDFDGAARMWEAAYLADIGQVKESAVKAQKLYEELGDENRIGQASLRIWAASSRGSGSEAKAMASLKALLDGDHEVFERIFTARVYSDSLFQRGDRSDEHLKLLERELARPDVNPAAPTAKLLNARLKLLRDQRLQGPSLTRGVNAWIEKEKLAYLKLLQPKAVDDPRFSAINGPLIFWKHEFTRSETLKYDLLLALDEHQTADTREAAFKQAVYVVAHTRCDAEDFAETIMNGMGCSGLSSETQASIGHYGAITLVEKGNPDLADRVKSRISSWNSTSGKESLEREIQIATLFEKRKEGWASSAFKMIVDYPVDFATSEIAAEILQVLVLSGESEEADRLLASSDGIKIDGGFKESVGNVRLNWTRAVRAAKTMAPFSRGLYDILIKLPGAQGLVSPRVRHQMEVGTFGNLTEQECFMLCLDRVRSGRARVRELYPLFHALDQSHVLLNSHRSLDVLALALNTPADDTTKAGWVLMSCGICDADDPKIREEAETLLARFSESPEARTLSMSKEWIARYRAHVDLRASTEARPAALFAESVRMNLASKQLAALQLQFQVTRGNDAEALSLIDQLDAETMAEPNNFAFAKAVLARFNRPEELKLLEDSVREKIAQLVANVWLSPEDVSTLSQVLDLMESLGDASLLSDPWCEHVANRCRHAPTLKHLSLVRARLRQDWVGLKKVADDAVALWPDSYDNYYDRALAEYHLNQFDPAKQDLAKFLSHARTSPDYRAAVELEKELSGSKSLSAPGESK